MLFMLERPPQDTIENVHQCFFLDKQLHSSAYLREAMTMKLNKPLVDCATVLQTKQLLVKLSSGDEIAQEMKYYLYCINCIQQRDSKEEKHRG